MSKTKNEMAPAAPPVQGRRRSLSDPLSAALQPPENETPEERAVRVKREAEARLVSQGIDESIRRDAAERKKNRAEVNVLLLGQSESGKSTTLKQFQLLHSPAAFRAERIAWRAVIYLNLVRSIRRILDALAPDPDESYDEEISSNSCEAASIVISPDGRPPSAFSGTRVPNYERYRNNLEPLAQLEDKLIRMLTPGSHSSTPSDEEHGLTAPPAQPSGAEWPDPANGATGAATVMENGLANGARPTPTVTIPVSNASSSSTLLTPNGMVSPPDPHPLSQSNGRAQRRKEVAVHTSLDWKKAFAWGSKSKSPKSAHSGEIEGWWEDPYDPVHTLHACAPAMMEVWRDERVRMRLKEKRLRLEESSGFYLDEISRITAKKYIPTDADVLKARLKTMGVIEHTFSIPSGHNKGVNWKIYDVGGARNQRQAWAPYFEDVNAIIFLAPISAFDQVLTEDNRVNRLQDSLELWKAVSSNKLLAHVNLVLFLNKCDLLQQKLAANVRLNEHMISYSDRPNDYESICKYFHNKFRAIHYKVAANKERELYIHFTTVTDTRQTATIITTVRDIIIKNNLKSLKLV